MGKNKKEADTSVVDALTATTRQYITKTMLDSIFGTSPLWQWNGSSYSTYGTTVVRKATQTEVVLQDEPSDFELWARQIRAEAGIIDPPRKPAFGGGTMPITGQFLWSGKLIISQPSYHGQLVGISGPEESDSPLDKE